MIINTKRIIDNVLFEETNINLSDNYDTVSKMEEELKAPGISKEKKKYLQSKIKLEKDKAKHQLKMRKVEDVKQYSQALSPILYPLLMGKGMGIGQSVVSMIGKGIHAVSK